LPKQNQGGSTLGHFFHRQPYLDRRRGAIKYLACWAIDVFLEEAKQLRALGKSKAALLPTKG
jgi:hypothetical protein